MSTLTSFFPPTTTRVESSTCAALNDAIYEETVQRVGHITAQGPAAINQRLWELEQEWDMERALQTGAASITLTTLTLAATVDRRWAGVTAAVAAFLLLHALQGWCPPLLVLRRLGVRTSHEINVERVALRLLRDDFAVEASSPEAAVNIASDSAPVVVQDRAPSAQDSGFLVESAV